MQFPGSMSSQNTCGLFFVVCLSGSHRQAQRHYKLIINTCHRWTSSWVLQRAHTCTCSACHNMIDWPPQHHKGWAHTNMFTVTHRCSDVLQWHHVRIHLHNTDNNKWFSQWADAVPVSYNTNKGGGECLGADRRRADRKHKSNNNCQFLHSSGGSFVLIDICLRWEE